MKPIFSRGPSLQIRLVLVVLLVFVILVADSRFDAFRSIRSYLDTAVSPFYFIANGPQKLLDGISNSVESRQLLEQQNQALHQELLLKNSELLLLGQYKQENDRLRELLGSPLRQDEQKKVARVIATAHDPYSDQVVIDKGSDSGVYQGQPVIDDKGVAGQVVAVAKYTSRVLLICDSAHALPVQVLRNDIRTIAAGNGCNDDLSLEHLPASTDIRVGDVLVTSGLGGVFPEGYPVAIVSSVQVDHQQAWKVISAHPTAGLQRLRYLLLLWNADPQGKNSASPQQVHDIAAERLRQMLPQALSGGTDQQLAVDPAESSASSSASATGAPSATPLPANTALPANTTGQSQPLQQHQPQRQPQTPSQNPSQIPSQQPVKKKPAPAQNARPQAKPPASSARRSADRAGHRSTSQPARQPSHQPQGQRREQ